MINPYQPTNPAERSEESIDSPWVEGLKSADSNVESQSETQSETQPNLIKMFGKWSLICTLSAIPSFVLGSLSTDNQYLGMATGIFLFIIGYVCLDRYTWNFAWRKNPVIRRILRVMYTTRIAISCSMMGTPLDMACGIAALGATHLLMQNLGVLGGPDDFIAALIGTIFQGIILNAVLLSYGLVLLACYAGYKRWTGKS